MKLKLWQFLMVVTWVAVILGVLFNSQFPVETRGGGAMVLLGLLMTYGRAALPRPKLREHVPNDRQLHRWSDLLVLGIPAFFLLSIGLGVLFFRLFYFSSVLIGFVVGSMLILGYGCLVFTRDVDGGD